MEYFTTTIAHMTVHLSTIHVYLSKGWVLVGLSILCFLESPAQVDSALTFYPLGAGYRWQYTHRTESAIGNHDNATIDDWIEKDTLLQNGKRYWIRNRGHYPTISERFFERLDSVKGNVYQVYNWPQGSEQRVDSLRSTLGDTIRTGGTYYRCTSIAGDTVCGTITRTRKLVLSSTGGGKSQYTSSGIGVSYRMWWSIDYPSGASAWGAEIHDLVYARINGAEYGTLLGLPEQGAHLPDGNVLCQNYPNPFNPSTSIRISISTRQVVTVSVFDLLGKEVATLLNGVREPGSYTLEFDGRHLPSGVYICRMSTGATNHSTKLVLLK